MPFQTWWSRFERLSANPPSVLARMHAGIDVRGLLESIHAPNALPIAARVNPDARGFLAQRIPSAQLTEIAGRSHPIWTADVNRVVALVEELLTGTHLAPSGRRHIGRVADQRSEMFVPRFDGLARAVHCAAALREKAQVIGIASAQGDSLSFLQVCSYPDGTKVFCAAILELKDGMIAR